ncbi:cofilin/tropomyosin-type actin-binding protein [Ceratobasidium sp. AG-Ba]|nr:cofilin/tropomyosin-type actin-binding protein [Ceratobasidium sp. AG-Ba]QRW06607.1 cofilin/tropomyosin-type actin-binding protein [Ceratobasidium sp. AG-Ba]
MASRLGIRIVARPMRQPVVLSPQISRRMMSSGTTKQSSDTPWIAGAAIGTIGALAFIYSPSGEKAKQHHAEHATTPKKAAAAAKEKEEASTQPKELESGDESKSEGETSASAVQDSVKKSINYDGDPSAAKKAEEKEGKGGSNEDESVTESVKKSMNFDGDPASAKASEAKEPKSPRGGNDSESDGDFVKIEKMEVPEVNNTLKKENIDVPAIAKNDEEKQTKSKK